MLKGDFREKFPEGVKADVILSDLSPNLSGIANVDQARALELALAAIGFCRKALKPDGVFVAKAFRARRSRTSGGGSRRCSRTSKS